MKPEILPKKDEMICTNCETILPSDAQFCLQCGQKTKTIVLPFKEVVVDWLAANFNFDTKLWNSIKTMFTKPGQISLDYTQGKRERYMLPLKLFIFAVFINYLIPSVKYENETNPNELYLSITPKDGIRIGEETFQFGESNLGLIDHLNIVYYPFKLNPEKLKTLNAWDYWVYKKWDKVLSLKIYEVEGVYTNIEKSALVLLCPILALLLKLFYRKKKYFIENLIFSIHFFTVVTLITIFIGILEYLFTSTIYGYIILGSVFIYLVWSLHVFFKSKYVLLTIVKALCLFILFILLTLLGYVFLAAYTLFII